MVRKKYYEAEFGVWVEEPDPLEKPACDAIWNGDWDHQDGPRPRCFRPRGHDGEHHETRALPDESGWVELFWTGDPAEARAELRRDELPPEGDSSGAGTGRGVDEPG